MKAPGLLYGLRIIDLVIENNEMGFNELKQILQITPSSLNRYVQTLLAEEYLSKASNQKYVIGKKLLLYFEGYASTLESEAPLYPILEALAYNTPYTAVWFKFELGKIICRDKAVNPNSVSMQEVGEVRTDYLYHPWGYLLLDQYSEKERSRLISFGQHQSIDARIPDPSTRDSWFAHIHEHGYADDQGKVYQGIRRIAIPYYDSNKRLLGAVALGAIEHNVDDAQIRETVSKVKDMITIKESVEY